MHPIMTDSQHMELIAVYEQTHTLNVWPEFSSTIKESPLSFSPSFWQTLKTLGASSLETRPNPFSGFVGPSNSCSQQVA